MLFAIEGLQAHPALLPHVPALRMHRIAKFRELEETLEMLGTIAHENCFAVMTEQF